MAYHQSFSEMALTTADFYIAGALSVLPSGAPLRATLAVYDRATWLLHHDETIATLVKKVFELTDSLIEEFPNMESADARKDFAKYEAEYDERVADLNGALAIERRWAKEKGCRLPRVFNIKSRGFRDLRCATDKALIACDNLYLVADRYVDLCGAMLRDVAPEAIHERDDLSHLLGEIVRPKALREARDHLDPYYASKHFPARSSFPAP